MNVKTKYTVYKLNAYFSENELFDDEGSVEHILPENQNEKETLNIGNLIILEGSINEECDTCDYEVKRKKYMESSRCISTYSSAMFKKIRSLSKYLSQNE